MKLEDVRIGELDLYLFGQGTHYDIYKKLGAHPAQDGKKKGVYFAVWAPHAASVHVVGDFNGWEETVPMTRLGNIGIYEAFVEGLQVGDLYKYVITTRDGRTLFKSDPFGNHAELRPGTASKVADISDLKWSDAKWIKDREKQNIDEMPMSIYEVHIGSWKKHAATEENPEGFYNYREFAHEVTEYVKEMGYTHVELMGIAEHPFDGSWGYQVIGYYAPTARYGTPEDFQYMINYLHKNGIGVILDWVPAHFPRDAAGLADFDGQALFEYPDPRKGEHPDWGTKVFNYEMNEVKNFLIANALYWVEQFHVDGLRVDAVASMLYLDYGRRDGQWIPNKYGENKNLEAIEFFRHLNTIVTRRNQGVMMIAEESTAWPQVTGAAEDGGLAFTMKWNMGWMHDFLDYMKLDPYFRSYNHNKMTFSLTYAFSERFILVLSHDEVVHLKCSMINKMPGYYEDKLANLKAGYSYMIGHPGKKLLFMGQDFAQLQEWSEERELDWYLLQEEKHQQLQAYVKALLHLYKEDSALYGLDQSWEGFEWINADDNERSIFSFIRHSKDGKSNLIFVINFTPVAREDYRVGVPQSGYYKLILNSDDAQFGGSGEIRPATYRAKKGDYEGKPYSFGYSLPAYGAAVFRYEKKEEAPKKAAAKKVTEKKTAAKKEPEKKETVKKTTRRKTVKKSEE